MNDQQGKMIYQKQLPATNGNIREKIDMSRFAAGAYFVTVYFNSQEKQTLKIIKN
ncbi:T9SS type A sorting domain-containing protein [Ferruginibacter sp.]